MNTLYTDLQKLIHDHCDAVVCVNGSMLAKDLRALLERNKDAPDYESMFMSAYVALADIHEALGLNPDDAEGAEPIIEAIAEQSNTISSYMDINDAAGKENEMLKAEIVQLRADLEKCRNACLQEVSDFGQLQSALEENAEPIQRVRELEACIRAAHRDFAHGHGDNALKVLSKYMEQSFMPSLGSFSACRHR